MAKESDNKRFYWAKIKEDFFTSDVAKIIKRQKNGFIYLCLFQELLLRSVNTDGWFITKAGEMTLPWTPETLSEELICYDVDHIRSGITLLRKVGLIYQVDGIYRIADFENYVGSETKDAERMREKRKREKAEQNQQLLSLPKVEETNNNQSSPTAPEEDTPKGSDCVVDEQKTTDKEPKEEKQPDNTNESAKCDTFVKKSKSHSNHKQKSKSNNSNEIKGFSSKETMNLYNHIKDQVEFFNNDEELKAYFLGSGKMWYFGFENTCRLLNIAREIARHEYFTISGNDISSEEILKAFFGYFEGNGEHLYKAFCIVDEEISKGNVKNVLFYTIVSLYNYSVCHLYG